MPKPDVFVMRRPEFPLETKTFTGTNPDYSFALTLQGLNGVRQAAFEQIALELVTKYIGFPDEENPEKSVPPTEGTWFPHIDGGEQIQLNERLLRKAAMLFAMYKPPKEDSERFTVEEFIQMAETLPDAWEAIISFRDEVNYNAQQFRKNANGERNGTDTSD